MKSVRLCWERIAVHRSRNVPCTSSLVHETSHHTIIARNLAYSAWVIDEPVGAFASVVHVHRTPYTADSTESHGWNERDRCAQCCSGWWWQQVGVQDIVIRRVDTPNWGPRQHIDCDLHGSSHTLHHVPHTVAVLLLVFGTFGARGLWSLRMGEDDAALCLSFLVHEPRLLRAPCGAMPREWIMNGKLLECSVQIDPQDGIHKSVVCIRSHTVDGGVYLIFGHGVSIQYQAQWHGCDCIPFSQA